MGLYYLLAGSPAARGAWLRYGHRGSRSVFARRITDGAGPAKAPRERVRRIIAPLMLTAAAGMAGSYWVYLWLREEKPTVIFILGGPGCGKGTQGSRLAKEFGATHLSAGELLRKAQENDPKHSDIIARMIRAGQIVPHEITISLLKQEMDKNPGGIFIIDGFPRKMDQALKFEEKVCGGDIVIFYECPEELMVKRLLGRSECSGREDDNMQSIVPRFKTYKEMTIPVIKHYDDLGIVRKISCEGSIDDVYKRTVEVCSDVFRKHRG